MLEGLKAQMDRVRFLSLPAGDAAQAASSSSTYASSRGSGALAEQAEEAMRRHLSEIFVSLPKLAAENPTLFAG